MTRGEEYPSLPRPIDHYLPGERLGGVLRSTVNLVEAFSGEMEIRVVTRDRDYLSRERYRCDDGTWHEVAGARVRYLSDRAFAGFDFGKLRGEWPWRTAFLNGVFSPACRRFLAWRAGAGGVGPTVVAARGSFLPGAMSKSALRKRLFLALSRLRRRWDGVVWLASSEAEGAAIRKWVSADARIIAIPDLPSRLPRLPRPARDSSVALRVVFARRIEVHKAPAWVLGPLARSARGRRVVFRLRGDVPEPGYALRLAGAAREIPGLDLEILPPATQREVLGEMAASDLVVLPSKSENYAHVVPEAWSQGVPVLISDQTPWRDLEAAGLGLDCPLDQPQLAEEFLARELSLPEEEGVARADRLRRHYESAVLGVAPVVAYRRLLLGEEAGDGH